MFEWQLSAFGILLANEEFSGSTIKHCLNSLSVDRGLDFEVISTWRYFTNTACRDGIIYGR